MNLKPYHDYSKPPLDYPKRIDFTGHFIVTGKIATGTRDETYTRIKSLSGIAGKYSYDEYTPNYLIIAQEVIDGWQIGYHQRNSIRDALHARLRGRNITIISEAQWLLAINKQPLPIAETTTLKDDLLRISKIANERKKHAPGRTTQPIANIATSDDDTWTFTIRQGFSAALDISYDERIKDKKKYMAWTQGMRFDFHQGDVFYRHKKGETLTISDGNHAATYPNTSQAIQVFESSAPGFNSKQDIPHWDHGTVVFDLWCNETGHKRHTTTQTAFVELLRSGVLPTHYSPNQHQLFFMVRNKNKTENITISRQGQQVTAACTCSKGQTRKACCHIVELIDGYAINVLSRNLHEVPLIANLTKNSNLEHAYRNKLAAEIEGDIKLINLTSKNFDAAMYDDMLS